MPQGGDPRRFAAGEDRRVHVEVDGPNPLEHLGEEIGHGHQQVDRRRRGLEELLGHGTLGAGRWPSSSPGTTTTHWASGTRRSLRPSTSSVDRLNDAWGVGDPIVALVRAVALAARRQPTARSTTARVLVDLLG